MVKKKVAQYLFFKCLRDTQFTVIEEQRHQKIFTFQKLMAENETVLLQNYSNQLTVFLNSWRLNKKMTTNQLINCSTNHIH